MVPRGRAAEPGVPSSYSERHFSIFTMTQNFKNLNTVLSPSLEAGQGEATAAKWKKVFFPRISEATQETKEDGFTATPGRTSPLRVLSSVVILGFIVFVNREIPVSSIEENPSDNDSVRVNCTLPENPYYLGSEEYEGFEWAEQTHATSCVSNGLFRTGCEEYTRQITALEKCSAGNR